MKKFIFSLFLFASSVSCYSQLYSNNDQFFKVAGFSKGFDGDKDGYNWTSYTKSYNLKIVFSETFITLLSSNTANKFIVDSDPYKYKTEQIYVLTFYAIDKYNKRCIIRLVKEAKTRYVYILYKDLAYSFVIEKMKF